MFRGATTIENASSSNYVYWGYSVPDTFLSALTLINRSTKPLWMNYTSTGQYGGDITLDGDSLSIVRFGSSTAGRVAVFDGSTDQALNVLNGGLDIQFYRIKVSKPGGRLKLNDDVTVSYDLGLGAGIVECMNGVEVILKDGVLPIGWQGSFVEGAVRKIGNDAFTFPVGKNGTYRPIAISAPATTADVFVAEYLKANSNAIHDHGSRDSTLSYLSENEYWTLTRENGTSMPTVTLSWDTLNSCILSEPLTGLRVAGWSDTEAKWKDLGNGGTTGTIDEGTIETASGASEFNMFILAHDSIMDCCATLPAITQTGSLSPCEDDSTGIVTLWGSGDFDDYVWSFDGDTVGTGATLAVTDFRPYSLSRAVCTDTATYTASTPTGLHLVVTPQVTESGFNLTCYFSDDGMVDVTLGGGSLPYAMDYTYNGQPFPPNFVQLGAGIYTLNVTDQTGCTVADTAILTAPAQPLALGFAGADRTITAGESTEIGDAPIPTYTYEWYPTIGLSDPNVANPVAYPNDTTIYVVTVGTQDTCVSKDTVMVNVLPWTPAALDSTDIVFIDSVASHVAGELIVKFKKDMLKMDRVDNINIQRGDLGLFLTDSVINLMRLANYGDKHDDPTVMDGWGIRKIFKRLTSNNRYSTTRLGEKLRIPDFWATFVVALPDTVNELVAMDSIDNVSPQVEYAEPNHVAQLTSVPNDPLWEDQLSLDSIGSSLSDINILPAWDIQTGQSFIKVGVYDSGIEWEHEDFQVDGSGTYEGSKVKGWDYHYDIGLSDTPERDFPEKGYHGTAVAGIIGALRNNNRGIAGIAGGDMNTNNSGVVLYGMKISSAQIFNYFIPSETIATAIEEGATMDVDNAYGFGLHIMSNSWVSPVDSLLLDEVVRYAYLNQVIFVAARGNYLSDGSLGAVDAIRYPACLDSNIVLSVAASSINGELSSDSKYGSGVDLIAPGSSQLIRTVDGNPATMSSYKPFSNTSAAAPHVAGVAALMLSQYNTPEPSPDNLAPEDVEYIMKQYAKDRNVVGWDQFTGMGLLDAGQCLKKIQQPVYTIWHSQLNPIQISDSLLFLNQFILLTDTVNGIPPGNYFADRYHVTHTFQHSVPSSVQILDGWARYSSTNGYPDLVGAFPVDEPFMEGFDLAISGNTATVKLSTYALHVIVEPGFNGDTIDRWIPDSLPFIKLPFSLHLLDSTYVGIDEVNEGTIEITIYPNPSNDDVTLEISSANKGPINIVLINTLGQTVKEIYSGSSNRVRHEFSVADLSSGIYFIKISLPDQILTHKLTVYQ